MTEDPRQALVHVKRMFITQVVAAVVMCVAFALLGGLASLFTAVGWSWTWCLYGAGIGFGVAYFVFTTAMLAGAACCEDELRATLDGEWITNERLEAKLLCWERFQKDVPLQEVADTYVARCLEACREAFRNAQEWANKSIPDNTTPEEREVDYDELRVRLTAYDYAYCVYQEACHRVEMLGFNTVERAELRTPYQVLVAVENTFMDNRLGPDAP